MKTSKFTEEQIAFALKQAELGTKVEEIRHKLGISEATFYNWQKKFGGLVPSELRRSRRLEVGYALKCGFINPHRHVASIDQAGVVGRPVPDAVAGLRLARLALVLTHRLGGKNRESTQEPELLTRAPPRLLRVNVRPPRDRRINATTPLTGSP